MTGRTTVGTPQGPMLPAGATERWFKYVGHQVNHIAEASGFATFELRYVNSLKRRIVVPEDHLVVFSVMDKGKPSNHCSLLRLRLVAEENLPEQVQVGIELRGRDGESVVCAGEHVEFELLSSVNDAANQPLLKICCGPVRQNAATGQREFMRIDLGRCVRQVVTDIVDDPKRSGQKLVRSRWWICVEVLRLVCITNSLNYDALDREGSEPMEWVICLIDEGPAQGQALASGAPQAAHQSAQEARPESSIDELAKFIDSDPSKKKKKKKKKKAKGDGSNSEEEAAAAATADTVTPAATAITPNTATAATAAEIAVKGLAAAGVNPEDAAASIAALLERAGVATAVAQATAQLGANFATASSAAKTLPNAASARTSPVASPAGSQGPAMTPAAQSGPPPGWNKTVSLPQYLIDLWCDCAGEKVENVAECTGLMDFTLSHQSERGCELTPCQYVVAFPELSGNQRIFNTALFTMCLDSEGLAAIERTETSVTGSLKFELLARENESPVQTAMCFSLGPVRVNSSTGHREWMRLDLGEHIRWAPPDYVQRLVGGKSERLVRQRWWVRVDTLRLILAANDLASESLDRPGDPPLQWVCCLVDDSLSRRSVSEALDSSNDIRKDAPAPASAGGTRSVMSASADESNGRLQKQQQQKQKQKQKPSQQPTQQQQKHQQQQQEQQQQKPKLKQQQQQQQASKAQSQPQPNRGGQSKQKKESNAPSVDNMTRESECSAAPKALSTAPKSQPSRALSLPSSLIDMWSKFARKSISHVAEASGFIHLRFAFDSAAQARKVTPEHYVIAFPNSGKGQHKFFSSLLTMRVVKETDIPEKYRKSYKVREANDPAFDYAEFELASRVHEDVKQLQISAGPVRLNPETNQREAMRIDVDHCVQNVASDVLVDSSGKRIVLNRWWISMELIQLVCTANSLDCSGLDTADGAPVEWFVCLTDARTTHDESSASPSGLRPEDCDIDDLVQFIDGKGKFGKSKNKKNKHREAHDSAGSVAAAVPVVAGAQESDVSIAGERIAANLLAGMQMPVTGAQRPPAALLLQASQAGGARSTLSHVGTTSAPAEARPNLNSLLGGSPCEPGAPDLLSSLASLESLLGLRARLPAS